MLANAIFQVIERNRQRDDAANAANGEDDSDNATGNHTDCEAPRRNNIGDRGAQNSQEAPGRNNAQNSQDDDERPKSVTVKGAAFSRSSYSSPRSSAAPLRRHTKVQRRKSAVAKQWTKQKAMKVRVRRAEDEMRKWSI